MTDKHSRNVHIRVPKNFDTGLTCHYCGCRLLHRNAPKTPPYYDLDSQALASGYGWFTYDHKQPLARGGSESPENLVVCCAFCNSRKADRDYEEFLNQQKQEESLKESLKGLQTQLSTLEQIFQYNQRLLDLRDDLRYELLQMHLVFCTGMITLMQRIQQIDARFPPSETSRQLTIEIELRSRELARIQRVLSDPAKLGDEPT